MRAIGVVGTAKNTGKTTCLAAVLAALSRRSVPVAVTSIGYDGEPFDHLTGLPKPRVPLAPGALVATAEGALSGASARLETCRRTGVLTALGEVILARVSAPGLAPLAGPPTGAGLAAVLEQLAGLGARVCLVDGAFGRMAPMVGLDGVILATGAARHRDVATLAAETGALAWIFRLPVLPPPPSALQVDNLLCAQTAAACLRRLPPRGALAVGGALSAAALGVLAEWQGWSGTCIFPDPVRLALAGPPLQVRAALERLAARHRLGVARALPLLACAVNPFYPEPQGGAAYREARLDPAALHREMSRSLPMPVVDVVAQGVENLYSVIFTET